MAAAVPSQFHSFIAADKICSEHSRRRKCNTQFIVVGCDATAKTYTTTTTTLGTFKVKNKEEITQQDSPNTQKERRKSVKIAWEKLVRWSRSWRLLNARRARDVLQNTHKVAVLGGGSFATAIATVAAKNKVEMEVSMLVRDVAVCKSINDTHLNSKYLPYHTLPENIKATTDAKAALNGADFCIHAVPVQFSAALLQSISEHVSPKLPFISVSKGLELNTLRMMSQIIPESLGNPFQPVVILSGPSFAIELMEKLPTAMVAASKDKELAVASQQLLASHFLRISTSSDVTGVEISGALKNVLAIAAGIVEGMDLGNNCMAALVAQGCSEIRWLATKETLAEHRDRGASTPSKSIGGTISASSAPSAPSINLIGFLMGAKATTLTGVSGIGDIMLTCFVKLSRNRTVGVRLGSGGKLDDILSSMNEVAEGVATAGAVIALAQKYHVKMPVLTAVARILDNELTPKKAVYELMNLPQVEEV